MSFDPAGFRSIKLKMCLVLLPAILIGLAIITAVAAYSSYGNISELATSGMQQTLKTNSAEIHEMNVKTQGRNLQEAGYEKRCLR